MGTNTVLTLSKISKLVAERGWELVGGVCGTMGPFNPPSVNNGGIYNEMRRPLIGQLLSQLVISSSLESARIAGSGSLIG